MMKKIVLLGNANNIWVEKWANGMSSLGFKIHLMSFEEPVSTIYSDNIEIFIKKPNKILGNTKIKYLIYSDVFKKEIKKIKPDVVHAHYATGYGILGYLIGFKPFVVSVWGSDILRIKNQVTAYLLRKAFAYADYITTTFENTKKVLIDKFNVNENKISTFFWGIDFDLYKNTTLEEINTIKKNLMINNENDFIIFSFRSFTPLYNQKIIVDIAENIVDEFPFTKFIFILGHGDPGYMEKIEEKTKTSKRYQNFIFIKKLITPKAIALITHISNVGISIPDSDQMSDTLLGFLLLNKIVILGETAFNAYIKNYLNYRDVYFIERTDIKNNLENKLRKIIENARKLKTNTGLPDYIDILERNFDLKNSFLRMQSIYEKILSENKRN